MNKDKLQKIWKKNKLLLTAGITIITLFFPIGFIHEFGHIVICVSNDYDFTLTVDDLALNTFCSNTPQPILLYFALGGIFGLIASVMLFLIPTVRKNKGIFIGVSVISFDHFIKAIFETYAHSAYLNNQNLSIYMGIITAFFMIILLWFFSKRR